MRFKTAFKENLLKRPYYSENTLRKRPKSHDYRGVSESTPNFNRVTSHGFKVKIFSRELEYYHK